MKDVVEPVVVEIIHNTLQCTFNRNTSLWVVLGAPQGKPHNTRIKYTTLVLLSVVVKELPQGMTKGRMLTALAGPALSFILCLLTAGKT